MNPTEPEHIMQYFEYAHLPPHLQQVSKPFGELAQQLVATLPRNPERTVALRKLLEGKDAAVRARLAKSPSDDVFFAARASMGQAGVDTPPPYASRARDFPEGGEPAGGAGTSKIGE